MLYRMYLEVILSYETQHCARCTFTNKGKKTPEERGLYWAQRRNMGWPEHGTVSPPLAHSEPNCSSGWEGVGLKFTETGKKPGATNQQEGGLKRMHVRSQRCHCTFPRGPWVQQQCRQEGRLATCSPGSPLF